jgi:hypothetical protein
MQEEIQNKLQLLFLKIKAYIDDRTNNIIKFYQEHPNLNDNKIVVESVSVNRNLNYEQPVAKRSLLPQI